MQAHGFENGLAGDIYLPAIYIAIQKYSKKKQPFWAIPSVFKRNQGKEVSDTLLYIFLENLPW